MNNKYKIKTMWNLCEWLKKMIYFVYFLLIVKMITAKITLAITKGNFMKISCLTKQSITNVDDLFGWAAYNGKLKIVKILASDIRLSSRGANKAFFWAVSQNHVEIVQFLSMQSVIDVFACDCAAFRKAVMNGHVKIVEFLVTHFSINSNICKEALEMAIEKKNLDVVKVLVKKKCVNVAADNNNAFCLAIKNESFEILQFLKKYL